jgi:hypothetical protein
MPSYERKQKERDRRSQAYLDTPTDDKPIGARSRRRGTARRCGAEMRPRSQAFSSSADRKLRQEMQIPLLRSARQGASLTCASTREE